MIRHCFLFLSIIWRFIPNRSSGLEYLLKTDSNIIFFPPNGRYEGEKHYICKYLEIPAVILRSLNNRRQANNRSTAEGNLADGIDNIPPWLQRQQDTDINK